MGKILKKELRGVFDLTCIDKKLDGEKAIALDIADDYDKFRNILKDNDIIVHLAWDNLEDFPSENIVQQNKVMAENVYRAAVEKKYFSRYRRKFGPRQRLFKSADWYVPKP